MKSSFLPIVLLTSILAGCASLPLQGTKTLEDYRMPTEEPNPAAQTQTAQAEIEARIPPTDCPVTMVDASSFEPPAPHSPTAPWLGIFWFGSDQLWTSLSVDGVWADLPQTPDGFTQKIMWWSRWYDLPNEPEPALVVTGRRLDGDALPLRFYGATNAMAEDIGEAMLTGVEIPTEGCWEIKGQYKKAELSFVVWVVPEF